MNKLFRDESGMFRNLQALCVACALMVCAVPVAAVSPDEEEGSGRKAPEVGNAEPVATKAMRVIYDPETGEIISVPFRENGVLSAPLTKALTRSTEGLQIFELENGGVGVHLDGRFQHALMVRVKPDGSLETVCTSHSHEAENFLKGRTAGAKPAPRDK